MIVTGVDEDNTLGISSMRDGETIEMLGKLIRKTPACTFAIQPVTTVWQREEASFILFNILCSVSVLTVQVFTTAKSASSKELTSANPFSDRRLSIALVSAMFEQQP
jgi:hypothetical protein